MAGNIKLGDNRINRVASNEGFLSTINPKTFSSVWQGTIQAGQQLQRFGEKASELVIKQKRLADKLSLDDLLNTFDNKQLENEIKLSAFAKKDPTQLIDPNDGKSLLANEAYYHGMAAHKN